MREYLSTLSEISYKKQNGSKLTLVKLINIHKTILFIYVLSHCIHLK